MREVGGGRGEDVAPVERGRDDLATDRRVGDLPDHLRTAGTRHARDQAVVGQDEPLLRHGDGHQAAVRTHPGVDHGEVDRPGGEGVDDVRQHEAAFQDVLGRDRVADVHDLDAGAARARPP